MRVEGQKRRSADSSLTINPQPSTINPHAPPRSRTSPGSFEDCHASTTLAGRSDSNNKSRRLDSRQYQPVYKTGAFLSRATSASNGWPRPAVTRAQGVEPCSAVLEATCFPGSTLASRRHGKHGSSRKETNTSGRQGSRTLISANENRVSSAARPTVSGYLPKQRSAVRGQRSGVSQIRRS